MTSYIVTLDLATVKRRNLLLNTLDRKKEPPDSSGGSFYTSATNQFCRGLPKHQSEKPQRTKRNVILY